MEARIKKSRGKPRKSRKLLFWVHLNVVDIYNFMQIFQIAS